MYTECTESPCKNQGTCQILAGSYSCICKPEYTGSFCEDGTDYNCTQFLYSLLSYIAEIPTTPSPTEPTDVPVDNSPLYIIIGAFSGGALLVVVVVALVTLVSVLCICRKSNKYEEMEPGEGFPEKNKAYDYMMS